MDRKTVLVRACVIFCGLLISLSLLAQVPPNRLPLRGGQIKIFANGINIAWTRNDNFARDVTNFDEDNFTEILDAIQAAGGNSCRWWLHTNGFASPQFDADGYVTGLSSQEIPNMKKALDLAYERRIVISMCLWSFDMLQPQGQDQEMMKQLVEDPDKTQSYIDNALIPILQEIGDHPAVMCWEIFNEPEGMTTQFGWTPIKTNMQYVQQFINMLAGEIHRQVPSALVSNGSWNFKASTDVGNFTDYYRDDRLIAAGGDEDGTLDFIMVHYYPEWEQNDTSPFHNSASHWGIDKPIVIGEFPANGITHERLAPNNDGPSPERTIEESHQYAYQNGYAGVMSWSWSDTQFGGFDAAKKGISFLSENYWHGLEAHDTLWDGDEGAFITALEDYLIGSVSVFPNPVNGDYLNIQQDQINQISFFVSDMKRKILIDGNLTSEHNPIPVKGLPKGIYFLKLQSNDGFLIRKFVKN